MLTAKSGLSGFVSRGPVEFGNPNRRHEGVTWSDGTAVPVGGEFVHDVVGSKAEVDVRVKGQEVRKGVNYFILNEIKAGMARMRYLACWLCAWRTTWERNRALPQKACKWIQETVRSIEQGVWTIDGWRIVYTGVDPLY